MSDLVWSTQRIKVSDLKPYERNPRRITKDKYQKLVESIQRLGYMTPIIAQPDGTIIGGHARKKALQELKIKEVDVRIPNRALTEDEYREALLRDNVSNGDWDTDILSADFDMEFLDFVGLELPDLKNLTTPETIEDEAPAVQETAISVKGDVWILGKHRLMCGDSTVIDDVEKLMNGQKADLVFTDPPYNVDYSGRGKNNLGKIKNDSMSSDNFEDFCRDFFSSYFAAMKPLACIYVCHPDSQSAPKLAFEKTFSERFKKASTLIWMKQSAGMGWQDYRAQHEPILYGWKEGSGKHFFCGDRKKTTVWEIGRDAQVNYVHPTQKPVSLPAEAINNSSKGEDIVLDLFGGSGSTLIAAEQTGRTCYMMELDPIYCDVIIRRWQNLTGQQAIHESTGQSFGD